MKTLKQINTLIMILRTTRIGIKSFIILLMIIQVAMFFLGIHFLIQGSFFDGLFNLILNPIGLYINIGNLKQ